MTTLKKILTAAITVPVLGMTLVVSQPIIGGSAEAQAQSALDVRDIQRPSRKKPNSNISRSAGGSTNYERALRPCPDGVATHAVPCRPWNPPRRIAASKQDCSCQIKRVNGVNVKDCFVQVNKQVHYCEDFRLKRQ